MRKNSTLIGLILFLILFPAIGANALAADMPYAGTELNFLVLSNHRAGLED